MLKFLNIVTLLILYMSSFAQHNSFLINQVHMGPNYNNQIFFSIRK